MIALLLADSTGLFSALFPVLILATFLAAVLFSRRQIRQVLRRDILEQLAFLTRRGLPLAEGLKVFAQDASKSTATAATELAEHIELTGSLPQACQAQPAIFPSELVELIRAAEKQGALPQTLAVAQKEQEVSLDYIPQEIERLIYPVMLVIMIFMVSLFMAEVIYPKFMEISSSVGLGTSIAWTMHWPLALELLLIALLVGALVAMHHRGARRALVALGCKLPGLRPFLRDRHHARWLERAGGLLEAGVALPDALDVVARQEEDDALQEAARRAAAGDPLAAVLEAALEGEAEGLRPRLLQAAEAHGLGQGFERSADLLSHRARRRLIGIGYWIEVLPLLACGLVVLSHCAATWMMLSGMQSDILKEMTKWW